MMYIWIVKFLINDYKKVCFLYCESNFKLFSILMTFMFDYNLKKAQVIFTHK